MFHPGTRCDEHDMAGVVDHQPVPGVLGNDERVAGLNLRFLGSAVFGIEDRDARA